MINELTEQLSRGNDLTIDQMTSVMNEILAGTQNDDDVAQFLKNLTEKGESDDELLGMLNKMEEYSVHISPNCNGKIIDVCGTGGDKLKTFNISTAASFVIAGAGGNVAKHGNRSISGVSGSADIFEYFGFDLNSEPNKVNETIEKFGIGFMFAQKFHPAMKNVANARKVVGGRTAFNLLGPLTNPAMVKNQLIGVFSDDYQERIVKILKRKNAEIVMSVRSADGMDELSTTSKNQICMLKNNTITKMILNPQEVGLQKGNITDIQISSKEDAINSFVTVLNGSANKTKIEVAALNAAGGLIVSDIVDNFSDAVELALNAIDNGKAFDKLENFVKNYGDIEKLDGVKKIWKMFYVHASLITEIKFSSPAEGNIRQISDPLQIAESMISGGAKALSILTQPYLFNGSPEYFIKIRKNVEVPLLMKDITINKMQIDAAKKMGADYFLLIQALFDNG